MDYKGRLILVFTYNKCIIGEGVSDLEVLEKVSAPVIRISPRHWGTNRANLNKRARETINMQLIRIKRTKNVWSGAWGQQHDVDFLPLDVDLEHVGKCNVQLGHPDRGSGSCSRGRRKCIGLALDCGKQKPFAVIFIHHQNWKQLIVWKISLLIRLRKSWNTKGKSYTVESARAKYYSFIS